MVRANKLTITANDVHFACFCHASQATSKFGNNFFFVTTQAVDVNFRLVEFDAVGSKVFHFVDYGCVVQQGFGRDAAHVQAYAAQCAVLFNQGNFQAFVGCGKGGRVTTRAAA